MQFRTVASDVGYFVMNGVCILVLLPLSDNGYFTTPHVALSEESQE